MTRSSIAFAVALLIAGCAAFDPPTPPRPPAPMIPKGDDIPPAGPIDLGDWRSATASPNSIIQRYSSSLQRRYAPGSAMAEAARDLQTNQFRCMSPPPAKTGDQPDQVCRRSITERGCTYTWQAHLFDDTPNQTLTISRVRGLYDKRCADSDGLLGGPG
jgi:hypothetical protein